jgi:hypothetical protein
MDFDIEIFKGKKFSDLMKDIYANSSKKDRQINMLIAELRPLIKNGTLWFLKISRLQII